MASKPAFHALRTQQRLGYSVSLHAFTPGLHGASCLAVRIQSQGDKPPSLLRARVAQWLSDFRQQLLGAELTADGRPYYACSKHVL